MVEYLWWGQHTNTVAPPLLSPTSVIWALPRSVLTRAFKATALTTDMYDCLLRPPWPHGGREVFFLQDLITFVNGCGWAGQLQQVGPPLPSPLPQRRILAQSCRVCALCVYDMHTYIDFHLCIYIYIICMYVSVCACAVL